MQRAVVNRERTLTPSSALHLPGIICSRKAELLACQRSEMPASASAAAIARSERAAAIRSAERLAAAIGDSPGSPACAASPAARTRTSRVREQRRSRLSAPRSPLE